MEVRKGYKQTEVGIIPEDWNPYPLSKLLEFKNGLNKAKKYFGYGTPIVNYMDVFENPGLTQNQIIGKVSVTSEEIRNYLVKVGDVFFTRTSETVEEIGISAVMLEEIKDTVFSGFILRGRPKADLLEVYFKKYCFRSEVVRKQITSTSSYTTRALTNGRLLSKVLIPLPPTKAEQEAIATALIDADTLIQSLEELIAKKHLIKQGAMQELLKPKEGWVKKKLGVIADVFSGTSAPQEEYYFINGIYPFVRVSDLSIKGRTNNLLVVRDYLNENCIQRANNIKAKKGTILFPKSGAAVQNNNRAQLGVDAYIVSHLAAVFSYNNSNRYLYYALSQIDMIDYVGDKGYPSLKISEIKNILISTPITKDEQTRIADILSDMDSEITKLETRLSKYKQIKQGMMQELLTGKIRLI